MIRIAEAVMNAKRNLENVHIIIIEHSEAEFSHGICTECVPKLYPELYVKKIDT
jgi:hypothetical protein